ncbi:hypothetical protein [Microvirga pudoricolor]|uniref:hypothetical protein n=1 Tax=Microvirga pudoricolor TaxID=2778729 RepID=UPI00194FBB32|nr:hypothetical protein [Microvirga pudoricolor]MBM6595416.1 hypothetical protein [Microvirga pudoricolor]
MMTESNDQTTGDAPPSSLPENLAVSVEGFPNEEAALAMGRGMLTAVRILGRYIDVGTLAGITVAVHYDAALRDLDRGIEGLPPEERTNDEELVGVGKAVLVKRGGEVKTYLVFEAGPVCCLAQEKPDESDLGLAIALIAHECAHVEEHALRERQFPGTLLNKIEGAVPALLQQFSESFWCEYATCRAAAPFGSDQGGRYRETLSGRLERAREKARDAIKAYRSHHDQRRVFQEVGHAVLEPLRMASYLFGHLDGLAEGELPDVAAELPTDDEVFVRGITRLVTQLRGLWDRRDRWEIHEDMWILGETAFDVVRECGVGVRPREDGGAHIDVPYTHDTLAGGPNLAELFAMALRGRS